MSSPSATADPMDPPLWGLTWQKMMMWAFLVGDALLFGTFLASYLMQRQALGFSTWPDQSKVFSLNFITAMTFLLITSSATMATAVAAWRKGDRKNAAVFTLLTAIGGLGFLGMQAYEWTHFIHQGGQPWGGPLHVSATETLQVPGIFHSYFFTITGFHGMHVLTGVIILLFTAVNAFRGKSGPEGVELAGLYWHFVDLVWVFVFGFFYLI